MYRCLLSFHQWIHTNRNHSLRYKSSFTVSSIMSLGLLDKEINKPLFMQNYNGKESLFSLRKNNETMKQFTDLKTSKVILKQCSSCSITDLNIQ